jgi:hypothetical protein
MLIKYLSLEALIVTCFALCKQADALEFRAPLSRSVKQKTIHASLKKGIEYFSGLCVWEIVCDSFLYRELKSRPSVDKKPSIILI